MRLGILTRNEPVYSLQIYRDNLEQELISLGVTPVSIPVDHPKFDDVDVVWDPALISARFPHASLRDAPRPVVGTVHGLASHTLSLREFFPDPFEAAIGQVFNQQVTEEWKWFGKKASKIIAVSRFGAEEVTTVFGVPGKKVTPIYHGVAHDIFNLKVKKHRSKKPYLLQIAQYAAKKNVDRVIEAYSQLPQESRPDLVAILPNYEGLEPDVPGLRLIREHLSHKELAPWYRGALGFVFPSIHETFGLPVLEAMACGCPVVTSNISAIPELTGDAAILVNPRSVEEIAEGIQRLAADENLRETLRDKGLARAKQFTWAKSAREHQAVFHSVLKSRS